MATNQTDIAAKAAAYKLFLGHSGEFWDAGLILAVCAGGIVAAAVAVTTIGSIVAHKREADIAEAQRQLSELDTAGRVADAKQSGILAGEKAAHAQAAADDVHVKLKQAEARIADADARALEAKLALAQFKAPRQLSENAAQRITKAMNDFPGLTFDVAASQNDEAIALADQLEAALVSIPWTQLPWAGNSTIVRSNRPSIGIAIETGVSVQFELPQKSSLEHAVHALSNALSVEGIAAKPQISNSAMPSTNHGSVHIMVGSKP